TVCVVGKMRDLILQLSKSSIYSTKPFGRSIDISDTRARALSLALVNEEIRASTDDWWALACSLSKAIFHSDVSLKLFIMHLIC
ncbi:hypothetical protein KW485_12515, partial [Enterobacter kobei]|nr:hypothetical protein [Enterobacter kobei]